MGSNGISSAKVTKLTQAIAIVCALAAVIGVIYGFISGSWNVLIWVILASMVIFCARVVLVDVFDDRISTCGSRSYNQDFEDPVEISLTCSKYTFGPHPFYVYCQGNCIARLCRGETIKVKVPRGNADLGIIRVEGTAPKKYVRIVVDQDDHIFIYPDSTDVMLPYRFYIVRETEPDESVFIDYYKKQRKDSIRIGLGISIVAAIIIIAVIFFVRPF